MVGNRKAEEVVDPKLPEIPSSKALKRALLIALRCVDPDATKRPKMGHVIHMLEADDLLFHNVSSFHLVKHYTALNFDSPIVPKKLHCQSSLIMLSKVKYF